MEEEEKIARQLFREIGDFRRPWAIIGTVMGLVHVLENLGGGTGIEALWEKGSPWPFIATFIGSVSPIL